MTWLTLVDDLSFSFVFNHSSLNLSPSLNRWERMAHPKEILGTLKRVMLIISNLCSSLREAVKLAIVILTFRCSPSQSPGFSSFTLTPLRASPIWLPTIFLLNLPVYDIPPLAEVSLSEVRWVRVQFPSSLFELRLSSIWKTTVKGLLQKANLTGFRQKSCGSVEIMNQWQMSQTLFLAFTRSTLKRVHNGEADLCSFLALWLSFGDNKGR